MMRKTFGENFEQVSSEVSYEKGFKQMILKRRNETRFKQMI